MMDNHATFIKFDDVTSFKIELPFEVEAFGVETFEIGALDVEGCGKKSPSLSLSVSLKTILPILVFGKPKKMSIRINYYFIDTSLLI